MSHQLHRLAHRIRDELEEISRVVQRVETGWKKVHQTNDDYYLDGVGLNLHGFYSGLERMFELIATHIDGAKPTGKNWHQTLLQQMATEVSGIRPAVISQTTHNQLDEYRGFRHVVRNVYTYKFDPVKIQRLVENASSLFTQVQAELLAFATFLEQRSKPPA